MNDALPDGWPAASDDVIEFARRRAAVALEGPERVAGLLSAYYRRESNYAGATFSDLSPNDPYSFSASDLLAVTMLSVDIPQVAVRRLLEPGTRSAQLSRLLSDEALDVDLNLMVASTKTLAKMGEFYDAIKMVLAPVGGKSSDRWVTASKLCARKRPDLFPVRDDVVTSYLGTRASKSYAIDWQVFRALLRDDALMRRLRQAVDTASSQDDVRVGDPNGLLRHLDVALWMTVSASHRAEMAETRGR